ncbi:sterol regulatory element-binding protein cleavage-activating protein-like [Mizuhopecten yessoensis]|uniref:Sterol regulatory element-binding protein cleavage-activating protein n=1 Tax=Mizuhopecten yessoensis TaxID=6573 RepID=A0A210PSD7_MIZYE|nr:sterol regulatory element-binding protein cleavage-activating protein-like [Mizuhopecten yessoensis]XP_021376336.1 sterol regulatory element-binding protein cleavage-activating protein-like [Mizuhopecten yessoensis]OWF39399.1 Sterol regulatory element-binding protein cleavage-activating protein [Mizuhopecten yessoensis]
MSLQDRVARIYYTHGLFCASHPYSILCLVISLMLVTFLPLLYVPLPGNVPVEHIVPLREDMSPTDSVSPNLKDSNNEGELKPRWLKGPPVGYVQQITVRAAVYPWSSNFLAPMDAFRTPLSKVFDVIQQLENFKFSDNGKDVSVADVCLRVSETVRSKQVKGILPEYACLEVSPANFWGRNRERFISDGDILRTIFQKRGQTLDTSPYLRDILLGVPYKNSGVSRYFIRNLQRTISFAVTIVLKKNDQKFIDALKNKLVLAFPDTLKNVNNTEPEQLVHVHYKENRILLEYKPLILTYVALAMYLYFSVRKIEMVKSKWGLAVSAVVTIVSSLLSSVSICTVFGLTPTLNGGEIFPYLVVLIGVENVMVITKSVVSTPVNLEVKHRIAQGISKEGWSITKNLATELMIIICGFFTFVPEIQEFALFAMVGLLTDFFLQIVFFVTVLSVDIRRMELSDLNKQPLISTVGSAGENKQYEPLIRCPVKAYIGDSRNLHIQKSPTTPSTQGAPRSPPITPREIDQFFENAAINIQSRRLRLLYFWASTRMVQRMIMVCTVIWISLIVYKSGLVEHLTNSTSKINLTSSSFENLDKGQLASQQNSQQNGHQKEDAGIGWSWRPGEEEDPRPVEHTQFDMWRQLNYKHWPTLFAYYNITLYGKFISILPTIHLSMIVDPQEAIDMRHPSEQDGSPSKPVIPQFDKSQESSSLPVDKSEVPDLNDLSAWYLHNYDAEHIKQLYPKSYREVIITVFIIILGFICISYFIAACYHKLCPRDYGRRKSKSKQRRKGMYYKQIKESVPKVLQGHVQEIECVVTDGHFIISSCLGGQIRVWDSVSGDCLMSIIRKSTTPPVKRKPCVGRNIEDSDADLYDEYHGDSSTLSMDTSLHQQEARYDPDQGLSGGPRHRSHSNTKPPGDACRRNIFNFEPDLNSTIDTNFTALSSTGSRNKHSTLCKGDNSNLNVSSPGGVSSIASPGSVSSLSPMSSGGDTIACSPSPGGGGPSLSGTTRAYDFSSKFDHIYRDHRQLVMESQAGMMVNNPQMWEDNRARSWSAGDLPITLQHDASLFDTGFQDNQAPSVWCMTCRDGLIIAGCGNGRIEFWDGGSGTLKCLYGDSKEGVTALCFIRHRVVAARLDGTIDFLEMETFQNPVQPPHVPPTGSPAKGHVRNYSQSHINHPSPTKKPGHVRNHSHTFFTPTMNLTCPVPTSMRKWEDIIHVTQIQRIKAHQQPIVSLQCQGGRVVSASSDHTLKVYKLENCLTLYTLHGHEDKITVLYLDKLPPYAAASGDAEGTVRLWDLPTGSCIHKVKCHEGNVVALTCTTRFVISSGLDDLLVIWDRCKGNILHSLSMDPCGNNSLSLLNNNLLVTGGQGCIHLLDVSKGEILRTVHLSDSERMAFVNQIKVVDNTVIVCDYASEMKVIHFPTVLEKAD